MAHENLTDAELTEAREDALDEFTRAAGALETLFNDLAVLRYPSADYSVRHAMLPVLKAELLARSEEFTSLHNELDRRDRETEPVAMACTACRKPVHQLPPHERSLSGQWAHDFVTDARACPRTDSAPVKAMVAAGNENIPVAREFAR